MKKSNIFFKATKNREPFVYLYKNLYICSKTKDNTYKKFYPISVSFNKNEITFMYTSFSKDKTIPLFRLPVESQINKYILREKVESYWNSPIIDISTFEEKETTLFLSPHLIKMGFFTDLFQFDLIKKKNLYKFEEQVYFEDKNYAYQGKISKIKKNREIYFSYKKGDKEIYLEKWNINYELCGNDNRFIIQTDRINFMHIFLDFVYEIIYTNTFSDYKAASVIHNLLKDSFFSTLVSKYEYLDALYKLKDEKIIKGKDLNNYPDFLKKEKQWMETLLDEKNIEFFNSSRSIFLHIEKEIENVLFNTQIGVYKKSRDKLLINKRKEEGNFLDKYYDQHLIGSISAFFLRRYNLIDAFRTIFPLFRKLTYGIFIFFLLITTFGDYGLQVIPLQGINNSLNFHLSVVFPLLAGIFAVVWYLIKKINLFKLMLPRMFLGILIGWLSFAVSADLWKDYIIKDWPKIFILDFVLFVIITAFLFTMIRNRLQRLSDGNIIVRTITIFLFASFISLFQGLYITQLEAKDILSASGFFGSLKKNEIYICEIDILNRKVKNFDNFEKICSPIKEYLKEHYNISFLKPVKVEKTYPIIGSVKIYYLWEILLSQFMVAMLIGIVLQLLWEDRPITEPL